jgi:tRNA-(ms[2]io[6]A)-hydroxylase
VRSTDLSAVLDFLPCPTPPAWVEAALAQPGLLLTDHANCEKKAAGTALNLMFRYSADAGLMDWLSRLAREELRHFEQVLAVMKRRGLAFRPLAAARYAGGLRALVRSHEPARLVDTLIAGAFIEARSCERFAALAPRLDPELGAFYNRLLASESRHFRSYLAAAQRLAGAAVLGERIAVFAARERELIESPDTEFRFHSGPPGALPA